MISLCTSRALVLALVLALIGLALPAQAQEGAGTPSSVTAEAPSLVPPAETGPASGVTIPSAPPEAGPLTSVAAEGAAAHPLVEIVLVAHPVVQAVMAVLALAAFVALTILVQKLAEFALAFARLRRAARALGTVADLPAAARALAAERGPAAAMTRAAAEELRLSEEDPMLLPGTQARSTAALARIEAGAVLSLRAGTGVLASIGAIAPFVGLFGTVFGIMNSFLAIAETKTTNLAVVAPGIAEALLATAIGLAAAIPAVLIYNILSRRLAAYRHRLGDLSTMILVLQSRALDRLSARPPVTRPAPVARAVGA